MPVNLVWTTQDLKCATARLQQQIRSHGGRLEITFSLRMMQKIIPRLRDALDHDKSSTYDEVRDAALALCEAVEIL